MDETTPGLCPDEALQAAAALGGEDPAKGSAEVARLAVVHPDDARLPFLQGSFLAAAGDYANAIHAMARAVHLAPDFDLARFQLGFLNLTSGDPVSATEAWGPLMLSPSDAPLRLFAEGLQHLIQDEFADARARLEAGIARNDGNAPLNSDMRLILSQLAGRSAEDEGTSSVGWLLREAERRTRH